MSARELGAVGRSGIHKVEVLLQDHIFDYHNGDYVGRMARELRRAGVDASSAHANFGTIPDEGLFCDISALDESERRMAVEDMKASVDAAIVLGCECIVIHPGAETDSGDEAHRTAQVERSLGEILEHCNGKDIEIALENLPDFCVGGSCEKVVAMVDRLNDSQLGICLDTGHVNANGGDLVESVRLIGDRLVSLHVHDNSGEEDEHDLPFAGTIDWYAFRRALDEIGFDGVFMYELTGRLALRSEPLRILERVKAVSAAILSGGVSCPPAL